MFLPQQNLIVYPPELTNSQKKKYTQTLNQTYKDENGKEVYFIKQDCLITDDYRRFINEIITTPKQNILTIYDICKHQNSFYLGTECQDGAKLLTNALNDQEKVEAIIQIAKGLQELHKMSYIHRNVCPETIKYINDQWKLTSLQHVCDFVCVQYPPPVGLFNYHAPEYAFGKNYTEEIDIFALACVAYELFSSEKLFINPNEPRNKIPIRCNDKLNKMPPFIKEFIEQNFNNTKRSLIILLKDVNKFQDKQIDILQTQSQSQVFDATVKFSEKQQPQCAYQTKPPTFKLPVPIMETVQSDEQKPKFPPFNLNAEKRPSIPTVQIFPQNQFQNPNTNPCVNPLDQKKGVQFPITYPNFTQNQKQVQPQQQNFSQNDQQSNQQQVKNNQPFLNFQNQTPPNNQQVSFNPGPQPEQQKKLLQGSVTLQNTKPTYEVNKHLLSEQYQDGKKQQEMEKQKKQQEEEEKQQREEEMKKQQEEEKKREEKQRRIEEEQKKQQKIKNVTKLTINDFENPLKQILNPIFNNVRAQCKGLSEPQK